MSSRWFVYVSLRKGDVTRFIRVSAVFEFALACIYLSLVYTLASNKEQTVITGRSIQRVLILTNRITPQNNFIYIEMIQYIIFYVILGCYFKKSI